jgi:hypothetical protein
MRMVDAWRGGDVLRSLLRSRKPAQQSAGIDLENLGDLEDVVQREVALCPRHLADVAPVPAGVPVVRYANPYGCWSLGVSSYPSAATSWAKVRSRADGAPAC